MAMTSTWLARIRSVDVRIIASVFAALLLIVGVMWTIPTTPSSNNFSFDPVRRDVSNARPIAPDHAVQGNIVDGSDSDYYRVTSGSSDTRLELHSHGVSGGLMPALRVWNSTKNIVGESNADSMAVPIQPNATYYVQIWGLRSTTGAYDLTVHLAHSQ